MAKLIALALTVLTTIYYITVIMNLCGVNLGIFPKSLKMKIYLALIPFYYWLK